MGLEKIGPPSVENGLFEVTSFSCSFPKTERKNLQKAWPRLESALSQHGIVMTLNLVERSMTVSTTRRTRDPDMIFRARDLIELLSFRAPASQAISRILEKGHQMEIIKIGIQEGGLCSKFGINKQKYIARKKLLFSEKDAIVNLTGGLVSLQGDIFIAVSSIQGMKVIRKLVEDFIAHNLRPSRKIKRFRRNDKKIDQVMHKLQAFCL